MMPKLYIKVRRCLTLFRRRPVEARWRGRRRHLDIYIYIYFYNVYVETSKIVIPRTCLKTFTTHAQSLDAVDSSPSHSHFIEENSAGAICE